MHDEAPEQPKDRRRHARYEILAQVRVTRSKIDYVLELTNISRSGALVHLGTLKNPSWLTQDRSVELAIIVPVDFDTVHVIGTIVRIERAKSRVGFAVQFEPLSAEAEAGIERLIALARPQPPPLPKPVRPPPLPVPNRRRHTRFELLASVQTTRDDESYVLELTNISRSGALMHLGTLDRPAWVRVDETIDLAIADPETLDPVHVRAVIVRAEQRGRRWGFAVQFQPLDDAASAGVDRLLSLGRPQPPPLPT